MLLALDISNAYTTVGVFDGEALRVRWQVASAPEKTADDYGALLATLFQRVGLEEAQVQAAVIGSVVPALTETFERVAEDYFGTRALVLRPGVRTGLKILTENPRELGADRIANAVAAYHRHGAPTIVVDFGTATAFDAIAADGSYLGTVIAPGAELAANALHRQAAQLPSVMLARPQRVVGRNTAQAVQAGLLFGHVGLVEGILERMQREMHGAVRVVATGRFAPFIARESARLQVVDEDLTLHGLRLVHAQNVRQEATVGSWDGAAERRRSDGGLEEP